MENNNNNSTLNVKLRLDSVVLSKSVFEVLSREKKNKGGSINLTSSLTTKVRDDVDKIDHYLCEYNVSLFGYDSPEKDEQVFKGEFQYQAIYSLEEAVAKDKKDELDEIAHPLGFNQLYPIVRIYLVRLLNEAGYMNANLPWHMNIQSHQESQKEHNDDQSAT